MLVRMPSAKVHISACPGMIGPIINEGSLRFVCQVLDRRGLDLVDMDEKLYVYKYAVKPDLLMVLQCEVENYKRLEQSPFVLHISHAVRSTDADFRGECLRGFLLPFAGKALASEDWDWTTEDKESLMLDILDAVHDFEVRGVVHTDLKCANILLTPDGLKLIDLDFLGSTSPWSSPFDIDSRQAAVHTFGKTIWELFTEQVPHHMAMNEVEVEGSLPAYIKELVHDCCIGHKYMCVKQLYDATEQCLEPVRGRRVSTAELVLTRGKDKQGL
ncbi:hypothetical protein K439DRAFT_597466 [Ramaria rubella]|nr:hypothetical protein K439DRAFT_597466 [Ramaria rubella]